MGVECYKIEQRKGREEYICQLCGEKIHKGREYICESGRYDGTFFEHKRHIHCNAIAEAYFSEPWSEDEYTEDEILDYVRDVCCGCQKYHDDECEADPYACEKVIRKLVPESLQGAALRSVEENREDKP